MQTHLNVYDDTLLNKFYYIDATNQVHYHKLCNNFGGSDQIRTDDCHLDLTVLRTAPFSHLGTEPMPLNFSKNK